jgi:glucose-6-phosphate dehydrogenase assembly protein OpcA
VSVRENIVADASDGSRPFDAASIECDLKNMWKRAGADDATAEAAADGARVAAGSALYRAALANLVVPLDPRFGAKLAPVLVDVTRHHPSRLFTIGEGTVSAGTGLRARVGAICHRRASGGGLVCSEQVVLDSDPASTALIPSAVRSLLIGDLPTVLLDFHTGLDLPWIAELMDLADLVLVDSCLMTPGKEPELWRFLAREGSRRVHDLAWARLSPWRSILAEIFDEKENLPALGSVREVEIEYTGEDFPPPHAWLLTGWLASRLQWTLASGDPGGIRFRSGSGEVRVSLRRTEQGEPRVLRRLRLRSDGAHPLDAEVSHRGHDTTARVTLRAPRESSGETPFGYQGFAACIVGEIHRHASNQPLEDAARAAEPMMRLWRKP